MSDRWFSAAFFVVRDERVTLEELAAQGGVRSATRGTGSEFDRAHLDGKWAGLRVRVGLSRLALHDCLRIQLSQYDFLDRRPLDLPADLALANDPNLQHAEAFRDTCLALSANVGLFVTHPEQSDPDWIEALYSHVLGLDAEALAQSFVGLLYLDERTSEGFQPPPDRDTLTVPHGLVLFAGQGQARWY